MSFSAISSIGRWSGRVFTAGMIAVVASVALHCDRGPTGTLVGKGPIKNCVKAETEADCLKAWAAARAKADVLIHIGTTDELAVFPEANREDMKNAGDHLARGNAAVVDLIAPLLERGGAANLGLGAHLFQRVIWVVPARTPVAKQPVEQYRNYFLRQRRFPAESVGELRQGALGITGTVAGVPILITSIEELSIGPKESAILDIDLAYFTGMRVENPAYRPGTRALVDFLKTVIAKNIRATIVTVNLSTRSQMASLDLRYSGDLIGAALADPGALAGAVPEKWITLMTAEDSLGAKNYLKAAEAYRKVASADPKDAGSRFGLAISLGYAGKGIEARTALIEAYGLDGEYLRGFIQLARALAVADKPETAIEILEAPDYVKIMSPSDLDYQRGMVYFEAKRPFDAITYLSRAKIYRPNDFPIHTILYQAYRQTGDKEMQMNELYWLVRKDPQRAMRDMPWVFQEAGRIAEELGIRRIAAEIYEQYMALSPPDSLSRVWKQKVDTWRVKKLI